MTLSVHVARRKCRGERLATELRWHDIEVLVQQEREGGVQGNAHKCSALTHGPVVAEHQTREPPLGVVRCAALDVKAFAPRRGPLDVEVTPQQAQRIRPKGSRRRTGLYVGPCAFSIISQFDASHAEMAPNG